jgi:hypothetical protein
MVFSGVVVTRATSLITLNEYDSRQWRLWRIPD